MPEAGYVYALLNPSMEGLVKVGRTTLDPRDRANQLSLATGVPTPFLLAFYRFFSDSLTAEQYVHAMLQQKGYRVATNREFFNAPLNEVVEAILQASTALNDQAQHQSPAPDEDAALSSVPPGDDFFNSLHVNSNNIVNDLVKEANAYYYGHGDTLQDYAEAMRLYKQAARIGVVEAYWRLGIMYANGEGCSKDEQKALDFFKEGVRKGDMDCYAEMAELFSNNGHLENARKCWDRFFTGGGVDTSDSFWVGQYCYKYFVAARQYGWPLDHLDSLRKVKEKLQKRVEELIEYAEERGNLSITTRFKNTLDDILRTV